jgi:hypothetical protein
VLSPLQQFAERHFVAVVFAVFGAMNADPWPFILGYIAFGVAIDIWFARAAAPIQADRPRGGHAIGSRLRQIGFRTFFLGYMAAAGLILLTTITLATNHSGLLAAIGPAVYDLASPFIALLRNHYQDLLAHGFSERANVVAINYAALFLLFYAGLGFWLARFGYTRAASAPNDMGRQRQRSSGALWGALLLLFLTLAIIHFMTWADIDYGDHHVRYRRRYFTLNLNVAKYDYFFWSLAFMQGVFTLTFPLLLLFARLAPRSALPQSH